MNYDAVLYLVAAEHPLALESFQHELDYADLDLVAVETPAALESFQHVDLYLVAAEPPTVLESFEHELDVIDLWLVVGVDSVHVDGHAFDQLFFVL